ncbi:MAG: diacylglycerol/lipid kinase family protein [Phycisphaerae bacterium]
MPTQRSALIVANPTSGRGRGRRTAEAVAQTLRCRGIAVAVRYTQKSGDAERIARAQLTSGEGPPSVIVACGGDGTIQEVANALGSAEPAVVDGRPPLALAPAGRCNDFARVLRIPRDPSGIADVVAEGRARAIDLGRVNDRFFCTVATAGVDAEVSRFVDTMRMPLTGTPAYLYGAMRILSRYRARAVRIAGDFGVIERPVFLASSANTSSYGGAIPIAPDATPTDGLLDLCVIDDLPRLEVPALVLAVLRGRHRDRRRVQIIQTRRLTIDAVEALELWADGECVGRTPVTVEVVPRAIRIMLPAPRAE